MGQARLTTTEFACVIVNDQIGDFALKMSEVPMKHYLPLAALALVVSFQAPGSATGLATCDSGPQSGWKSQAELTKQLTDRGWKIRRIKIDGGCYEVYAIDEKGQRVESYFHPVTFKHVLTSRH